MGDVLCCLVWRNGIFGLILEGRKRHQIKRRPSPIGLYPWRDSGRRHLRTWVVCCWTKDPIFWISYSCKWWPIWRRFCCKLRWVSICAPFRPLGRWLQSEYPAGSKDKLLIQHSISFKSWDEPWRSRELAGVSDILPAAPWTSWWADRWVADTWWCVESQTKCIRECLSSCTKDSSYTGGRKRQIYDPPWSFPCTWTRPPDRGCKIHRKANEVDRPADRRIGLVKYPQWSTRSTPDVDVVSIDEETAFLHAFSAAYLSIRAFHHHNYYLSKFEDYPRARKIILPFLF